VLRGVGRHEQRAVILWESLRVAEFDHIHAPKNKHRIFR
jgi:hypothetical protein